MTSARYMVAKKISNKSSHLSGDIALFQDGNDSDCSSGTTFYNVCRQSSTSTTYSEQSSLDSICMQNESTFRENQDDVFVRLNSSSGDELESKFITTATKTTVSTIDVQVHVNVDNTKGNLSFLKSAEQAPLKNNDEQTSVASFPRQRSQSICSRQKLEPISLQKGNESSPQLQRPVSVSKKRHDSTTKSTKSPVISTPKKHNSTSLQTRLDDALSDTCISKQTATSIIQKPATDISPPTSYNQDRYKQNRLNHALYPCIDVICPSPTLSCVSERQEITQQTSGLLGSPQMSLSPISLRTLTPQSRVSSRSPASSRTITPLSGVSSRCSTSFRTLTPLSTLSLMYSLPKNMKNISSDSSKHFLPKRAILPPIRRSISKDENSNRKNTAFLEMSLASSSEESFFCKSNTSNRMSRPLESASSKHVYKTKRNHIVNVLAKPNLNVNGLAKNEHQPCDIKPDNCNRQRSDSNLWPCTSKSLTILDKPDSQSLKSPLRYRRNFYGIKRQENIGSLDEKHKAGLAVGSKTFLRNNRASSAYITRNSQDTEFTESKESEQFSSKKQNLVEMRFPESISTGNTRNKNSRRRLNSQT